MIEAMSARKTLYAGDCGEIAGRLRGDAYHAREHWLETEAGGVEGVAVEVGLVEPRGEGLETALGSESIGAEAEERERGAERQEEVACSGEGGRRALRRP